MHGATRCQKTGQRGAEERGNDVPPDCRAPEWRPECRTPERWSAAGVLSTAGDLGTAGVRAIRGPRKSDGVLSGKGGHTGAQEHRVANRLESEVVDALGRLSARRREEPIVTEIRIDYL